MNHIFFRTIEIKTINTVFIILFLVFGSFTVNSQQLKFLSLPSDQTNITFTNQLNETEESSALLYDNFYSGAGVAIGDVNNDGKLDIFFAGNQIGDQLYINQGNLKFVDQTEKNGIIDNKKWSTGVVMADVNADGWLDIYVCKAIYEEDEQLRANEFYLNNGDGTFTEQAQKWGIASTQRSMQSTFFDYDKDGDLDLFLVNQPPNPGVFSPLKGYDWRDEKYGCQLFRNDGNLFTEITKEAGVSAKGYGLSVSTSDFNNDGWLDLYVSNDYNSADFLYINQQDGTFKNTLHSSTGHISFFSMGTDVADINNDGWQDISTVDMVAEDNYRLKANMGGMEPDAFWETVREGGHYQYMFNALQLNRGVDAQGLVHFSDIAQMAGVAYSDWSWSPLFADFDNDGDKDLYVTNGLVRDLRNTDASDNLKAYYNAAKLKFQSENPNKTDVQFWDLIDLNVALEIFPSQPLMNYFFQNNGNLTNGEASLKFESKAKALGLNDEGFSTGSAYGDLDGDGDLDLVVNNLNNISWIYENKSQGDYLRIQVTDGKQRSLFGTKVEIIQKEQRQFYEFSNARGFYSSSENIAHFGLMSNAKVEKVIVHWLDGTISTLKNVKANQLLSINKSTAKAPKKEQQTISPLFKNETANYLPQWKHVENKFDDYLREVLLPHKMSQIGPAMAVADIDGDDLEDVFIGGARGFPAIFMKQGKDGKFSLSAHPVFLQDKLYEDVGATFFDADLDGDMDLYVVTGGNEGLAGDAAFADRLYLNDNGNWIVADGLPDVFESGSVVRPFDWDGDGDLDLFVGGRQVPGLYPSPASSYLLQNMYQETKTVRFENITSTAAPELMKIGMVTDAIWTDFDQDKDMDLILTGEWMPVTFLENNNGIFKKKTPLEKTEGWWYSIASVDMDNDGDKDYLVGNLGLNSKYKANKTEPFSVHYDDFDESGSNDIVLSYYNFGKKYPVRGRSCSSSQVPSIKEEFPTYDLFAQADVFEVYGEDNIEKALNYNAFNFSHIWIENTGKGNFASHDLPRISQMASINDWLILNKDNEKTIISAGNMLNTEVETPRQDANMGLVMKVKKGDLQVINPSTSGLYLPNEVKHLEPITVNGQEMFLVIRNHGLIELWRMNE